MHEEQHPLSGQKKTVNIHHNILGDGTFDFYVEDWWDRLTGDSWMFAEGNPTCIFYALRSGLKQLPLDDEVVYGHLQDPGGYGALVHVSELEN